MSKLMKDWGKMENDQLKLNLKLREYLKNKKNEYKSIHEYFNKYEKIKNKINDIDEEIFLSTNKDKSVLSSGEIQLNENKNMYGCYLNTLIYEYYNVINIIYNKGKFRQEYFSEIKQNLTPFNNSLDIIIYNLKEFKIY